MGMRAASSDSRSDYINDVFSDYSSDGNNETNEADRQDSKDSDGSDEKILKDDKPSYPGHHEAEKANHLDVECLL
ncbi:hypothetical protein GX50_02423 [[Emmonsia] crescens]|uniref:Uncharacterized protein n=1 Tax=[Emmonsia] crescens TaxID=73230 RepID=A0A2B7ZNJ1_9EURO|nr:hypothetical protein GX50_02423 [Emmonsia crescens]